MNDTKNINVVSEEVVTPKVVVTEDSHKTPHSPESSDPKRFSRSKRDDRPQRPQRSNAGGQRNSEFDHKMIQVRRVSRTVAGGRRFAFSATIVVGDKKGRVGVGLGKASDTAMSIEKATRDAKKNLVRINRTESGSIKHEVNAKCASAIVVIRPAPGRGLVAGAALRTVLEYAGITDVTSKILSRSKNPLSIARAAILALSKLS